MNLAERLRAIVSVLPPGSAVQLPADTVRAWLEEEGAAAATPPPTGLPDVDLTVPQLAELFGRGESTVRTWCAEGRFPNAYRLRGSREWRVPRPDVVAMQRAEAAGFRQQKQPGGRPADTPVSLSAWRDHVGGAR